MTINQRLFWATATLVGLVALLCGCETRIGKTGFSTKPVTPPKQAIVRVTVRSIGIHVGQNQATQTPEATIGYQSATYDRVPISIGTNIYAPRVKAAIDVKAQLNGAISEEFETGDEPAVDQVKGLLK